MEMTEGMREARERYLAEIRELERRAARIRLVRDLTRIGLVVLLGLVLLDAAAPWVVVAFWGGLLLMLVLELVLILRQPA